MRTFDHSSLATTELEPSDDCCSERRIAIRPESEPSNEALKAAVIAYARSQQPSSRTRERILSSVLAELGLISQRRKVEP